MRFENEENDLKLNLELWVSPMPLNALCRANIYC